MTDKTTELREQLVESLAATAPTEAAQEKVAAGLDLEDMAVEMGVAQPAPSSLLGRVTRGVRVKPPRLVLYGPPGIGKTTWAASAPSPIFLPTEEGMGRLDSAAFPVLRSWSEARQSVRALIDEPHDYKSLVIDTLDGLQPLLFQGTADMHNKADIEAFGFYKGYSTFAPKELRAFLDDLEALQSRRGMAIILLAHSEVVKHEPPDSEPYDRYALRLHKHVRPIWEDWCDAIFIAKYQEVVVASGEGNARRTRGVGDGDRVVYTQERPAWIAKNRWSLPFELPLKWAAFMSAFVASIPKNQNPEPKS